jgi:hypothetical protein
MSAYVVDKAHVDALVTAGLVYGRRGGVAWFDPIVPDGEHDHQPGQPWGSTAVETAERKRRELTAETADRVGAMLWSENVRSVAHRYAEAGAPESWETLCDLPGPADFSPMDVAAYKHRNGPVLAPVRVLKACDGYEYQSCEHPDWEQSEACAYLDALRRAMIRALPGYDSADW